MGGYQLKLVAQSEFVRRHKRALLMKRKLDGAAISEPAAIAMLTRVFEKTCRDLENNCDREQRAARLIVSFQNGMTDEAELLELSQRPLGR